MAHCARLLVNRELGSSERFVASIEAELSHLPPQEFTFLSLDPGLDPNQDVPAFRSVVLLGFTPDGFHLVSYHIKVSTSTSIFSGTLFTYSLQVWRWWPESNDAVVFVRQLPLFSSREPLLLFFSFVDDPQESHLLVNAVSIQKDSSRLHYHLLYSSVTGKEAPRVLFSSQMTSPQKLLYMNPRLFTAPLGNHRTFFLDTGDKIISFSNNSLWRSQPLGVLHPVALADHSPTELMGRALLLSTVVRVLAHIKLFDQENYECKTSTMMLSQILSEGRSVIIDVALTCFRKPLVSVLENDDEPTTLSHSQALALRVSLRLQVDTGSLSLVSHKGTEIQRRDAAKVFDQLILSGIHASEKATALLPMEKHRADFNNRQVLNGSSVERIKHPFLSGVSIVK